MGTTLSDLLTLYLAVLRKTKQDLSGDKCMQGGPVVYTKNTLQQP